MCYDRQKYTPFMIVLLKKKSIFATRLKKISNPKK